MRRTGNAPRSQGPGVVLSSRTRAESAACVPAVITSASPLSPVRGRALDSVDRSRPCAFSASVPSGQSAQGRTSKPASSAGSSTPPGPGARTVPSTRNDANGPAARARAVQAVSPVPRPSSDSVNPKGASAAISPPPQACRRSTLKRTPSKRWRVPPSAPRCAAPRMSTQAAWPSSCTSPADTAAACTSMGRRSERGGVAGVCGSVATSTCTRCASTRSTCTPAQTPSRSHQRQRAPCQRGCTTVTRTPATGTSTTTCAAAKSGPSRAPCGACTVHWTMPGTPGKACSTQGVARAECSAP